MMPYTTAQRLKQIMEIKHIKQADIIRAAQPYCKAYNIKLEKNDLSQYVNDKAKPGQRKLTILGLALGVSEAWLMGYDVPMERNITPTAETGDGRVAEFVELFNLLSAEQQTLIISAIKGLLSEQ